MARVNDDIRDPGDFFTWKTEVADFHIKIWNNSVFVIFCDPFLKFYYSKSRDMVQKGWKCIFDCSSTLTSPNEFEGASCWCFLYLSFLEVAASSKKKGTKCFISGIICTFYFSKAWMSIMILSVLSNDSAPLSCSYCWGVAYSCFTNTALSTHLASRLTLLCVCFQR